jgi:tetratricopeptide (TPR) repeat protein
MNSPTNPNQLSEEGKSAYEKGDYLKSAEIFLAAAEGYQFVGDAINAAEMKNNRSVALLQGGQAEAAVQAVEGTIEIFADAGDKRRQAMALGNRAAALSKLNRVNEAIVDYERAADLFKQVGEHDLRAPVLQALSVLQLRTGRQLESLASMNAGLGEFEQPKPRQRFLKKLLDIPLKIFLKS